MAARWMSLLALTLASMLWTVAIAHSRLWLVSIGA